MVWNAARLLSPLLLGGLYALLVEIGKPEKLFLVAGVSGCVVLKPDSVLLTPRHVVLWALRCCFRWYYWANSGGEGV
jgi:hypothetical protein